MCVLHAEHVTREFDRHDLHAEAQSETRNSSFSRIFRRTNLALDSSETESPRNDDAVERLHLFVGEETFDFLRLNPDDLNPRAVMETRVLETLDDREVGIV